MEVRDWQAAVRKALDARRDATRAKQMQAYMKSALPYYGVPGPEVRRIVKAAAKGLLFPWFDSFDAFVRTIWDEAEHREEKYAALTLLDLKQTRAFQTMEAVPLYEYLISDGAWWDVVDEVATHRFLPLFETDHDAIADVLRGWSKSDDLWLRRAAIISQVLRREETECELIFELAEPALRERAFFLRKAIGWALRAAAKHHPAKIRRYVDQQRDVLSGLSRREAEKGLAAAVEEKPARVTKKKKPTTRRRAP